MAYLFPRYLGFTGAFNNFYHLIEFYFILYYIILQIFQTLDTWSELRGEDNIIAD